MHTIDWPFRAAEALDAGALTYRELGRLHEAIHPGVWIPRGVELSSRQRAQAAWLWSRRAGVIAGLSAAALLGAKWVEPEAPAELIHTNRRPPSNIIVHSEELGRDESTLIAGLPVTTAARTAFDLGRRLPLKQGVQRIDALMNATGVKADDVLAVLDQHPGMRGALQLRKTLALVDGGAESPYESLTRLSLIANGFPQPQTQIEVHDEYGLVFARIDMGWPEYRVGVEFDGAHHWTDSRQRSWDVERLALLTELGWIVVRLTSGMLHNRLRGTLDRIGAALTARGCAQTW